MHKVEIPENIRRAVIARRGKFHVYESLVGSKTALLVIDLQNHFMLPGMPAEMPAAREIVPNVNRLALATRKAGGKVVWVRMTCTDSDVINWSTYFQSMSPARAKAALENLSPGAFGHELYSELDVNPNDVVINKSRYSAFIQGSSNLDPMLRAAGVDTVLIAGTMSNLCCGASARDAMMLNYQAIVVTDASAGRNDEEHNADLFAVIQGYGDVYTTDEIIALFVESTGR